MKITQAGILAVAVCAAGAVVGDAYAGGVFYTPTEYLSFTNSPWAGENADVVLEDFESGQLNTPGLSAAGGSVRGPSQYTDSVDFDDGLLDGWGRNGHSYWTLDGSQGLTFTFDGGPRGTSLPTIAGLVWTDGNWQAMITFEAFDSQGESIGSVQHILGDNNDGTGQTGEDRFLGVAYNGGISSIRITASIGGIEVDHVQFGQPIPAPAALALLGAAGLIRSRRRRV